MLTGHFGVAEVDDALGSQRHVVQEGLEAAVGVLKRPSILTAQLRPLTGDLAGLSALSRKIGNARHTLPADPQERHPVSRCMAAVVPIQPQTFNPYNGLP